MIEPASLGDYPVCLAVPEHQKELAVFDGVRERSPRGPVRLHVEQP